MRSMHCTPNICIGNSLAAELSTYQPKMILFYDWLHKTIVTSVYDSFFRKIISVVDYLLLL
jgi:hypothetical protein